MSLARIRAEDVTITGTAASFAVTAGSGNINTRNFCPKCGGRLYGQNSFFPGILNIAVGCIDDNSWFVPDQVVYAKDRLVWDVTSTHIPSFDRMP